jgi:hypothetical protein
LDPVYLPFIWFHVVEMPVLFHMRVNTIRPMKLDHRQTTSAPEPELCCSPGAISILIAVALLVV